METKQGGHVSYPADCWPWTVLMRRDRGEPVSEREIREVAEFLDRRKKDQEAWRAESAEWKRRESEHLQRLKPDPDFCEKILALAKAEAFGVERLQEALSIVAATVFWPPSLVDGLMPSPEAELAGAERALQAITDLSRAIEQMHLGRLHSEYETALYQSVRRIERLTPSMKDSIVVSQNAASIFAWNISTQLEHMAIALERRRAIAKSKCRQQGGQSALWKRILLVSAVGVLWDARRECRSNSPIPNGRDGSFWALFELAKGMLNGLCRENLSDRTIESDCKEARALFSRLERANFDYDQLPEKDWDVASDALLPPSIRQREREMRPSYEEVLEVERRHGTRWLKRQELRETFRARTGLRSPW